MSWSPLPLSFAHQCRRWRRQLDSRRETLRAACTRQIGSVGSGRARAAASAAAVGRVDPMPGAER
eukprot:354864-Chlamydomonas_euryale.AAC.1